MGQALSPANSQLAPPAPRRFLPQKTLPKGPSVARVNPLRVRQTPALSTLTDRLALPSPELVSLPIRIRIASENLPADLARSAAKPSGKYLSRMSLYLRSYRTISRFLYPFRRQSFILTGHRYPALAAYPEVHRDGPSLLPYLALLRVGFALPAKLLPPRCALTAPFHPYLFQYVCTVPGGIFSVALSVSVTGPRPLAGTLPCGDRTFLSRFQERLPIRQLLSDCLTFWAPICTRKHLAPLTKPIKSFEMSGLSEYPNPS